MTLPRARGRGVYAAFVLVLAVIATSTAAASIRSAQGCTKITVGANESLTGVSASIGTYYAKGFLLGIQRANGKGGFKVGGKCYRFNGDLIDNQSNPAQSISAYQRFVSQSVKFIFGPAINNYFVPAFQVLGNTDNNLVIAPPAAVPTLVTTPQGKNLFDPLVQTPGAGGQIAQEVRVAVKHFHPATVALLWPNDGAGQIHLPAAQAAFEKYGVKVVYAKYFDGTTRDFSSYIAAIRAENPGMIMMGYLDAWLKPFVDQAIQAGFTKPVIVGGIGTTTAAVDTSKISRYVFAIPTVALGNVADPAVADFRAAYTKKWGTPPTDGAWPAAAYYDPVLMLAKAMQIAGTVSDVSKIANAMKTKAATKYPGRMLKLAFDKTGLAHYALRVGIILNGKTSYAK